MLCSSIAGNGSDFMVSGTYPVTISAASGNCSGTPATTREILVTLSSPLQRAGNFTLTLQRGSDGNTILNECGEETPAGSFINFSVMDTVNADFTYNINYGCSQDVVNYFHPGNNSVNKWIWTLDENQTSSQQNPVGYYSIFNTKNIQCIVSNGFCSDTSKRSVVLENYLKADFTVFEDNCPNEPVPITNTSIGKITQYNWSFGDGDNGVGLNPVHVYRTPGGAVTFTITLTVVDSLDASKPQTKNKSLPSCILAVPNAFTPNSDGHNDFLYPLNAVKAQHLEFSVYNRWGQLMYRTTNWKNGWDGRFNGQLQATGAYVWMLRYVDRDTQKQIFRKGTAILIR
jgi:gliding motility-associated-like protein